MYIYLYIVNVFNHLFLLSENKESYLYHYYIKVVRFSLNPPSCSMSLLLRNNCINNGVINGLKEKKKKKSKQTALYRNIKERRERDRR